MQVFVKCFIDGSSYIDPNEFWNIFVIYEKGSWYSFVGFLSIY